MHLQRHHVPILLLSAFGAHLLAALEEPPSVAADSELAPYIRSFHALDDQLQPAVDG